MTHKENPESAGTLSAETAAKIEHIDAEIRGVHGGMEIKDIEGPAGSAFAGIGVNLTPEQIYDYAKSVSESTSYEFEHRG